MGVRESRVHRSCCVEGWVVAGLRAASPQHLEALRGGKERRTSEGTM